jgi:Nucleotidyl transferase AbiEii toxin, Type IV TA system
MRKNTAMPDYAPKEWHREVISAATDAALRSLRDAGQLTRFYLAGGTGLALHFGHRLSHDLDFFAEELFDEEILLQTIQRHEHLSEVRKGSHTVHATLRETKVSFLGYEYPLLFPLAHFLDVAVADPRDIACMKISAISSRGTMRDFVDLYVAAQRFGLRELLQLFDRKHGKQYNKVHVLKSLTFFEDAEKDSMPHLLVPLAWDYVKQFFTREAPRLT